MEKESLKNNKVYIILIIILIIYLLITVLTIKKINKKEKIQSYLVTSNTKFRYENKELVKLDDNSTNWKKYNIYVNNSYIGEYQLQYNEKWHIYDEDRNPIKYEGNIIATSNLEIKVYNYEKQDITDSEANRINEFLNNEKVNIVEYNKYNSKIEIDLDNDNKNEKLYIVNSKINGNDNNIFSMILLDKSNKITVVSSKVVPLYSKEKILLYDIYGIIDIEDDKKLEIIVNETQYSQPDTSNEQVYKLNNNKYKKLAEK